MNSQQLTKADLNKILNNALLAQDKRFDKKLNLLGKHFDQKLNHLEVRFDQKLGHLETRVDQKLDSALEKQKKEIISEITDFIEISLAPFLDKIIEKSKNHKKTLDEHEKQLSNHEERITSFEKVQVTL